MSLNKEQCNEMIEFFNREVFEYQEDDSVTVEEFNEMCDKYIFMLKQLIHEYFDNPPLKFEELEDYFKRVEFSTYISFPIWDKEAERWRLICDVFKEKEGPVLKERYAGWISFENDRFYRKQVEE